MTRKQQLDHERYVANRDERLARQRERSKEWYWKNHDYALAKRAATYQRLKEEAAVAPKPTKPSIESIEGALPYQLKNIIPHLRAEFLKIPILERPPYDVWLKQKEDEYLKYKNQ